MNRVRVSLYVSIVALILLTGVSIQLYQQNQLLASQNQKLTTEIKAINTQQAGVYQSAIRSDQQKANQPQSGQNGTVYESVTARAAFYLGTPDHTANKTLINQGWVPNCLLECNGITYYIDPTTVITNEGHDFIQFRLSGSANSIVPAAADLATREGLSSSATGAAVTDTFAAAGPCDANNIIAGPLFNTLSDAAGTVATGAPSAGSVTWTVTYTWTYSIGINTVRAGCLLTENAFGAHPYIFAEISGVGPFTLAGGDTIQQVWSITAT